MLNKTGALFVLAGVTLIILAFGFACQSEDMDAEVHEEYVVFEDQGILSGQIDSQSVEIEFNGRLKVFVLAEGVGVTGIPDGSKVHFTYTESEDRPVLHSIESLETEMESIQGEGVYSGQIDSNSVEIEVDGRPTAFALDEALIVDHILEGSYVAYSYREEDQRLLLESIEVIEEPVSGGNGALIGEGILVGLIDSRSVEIEINRAFMLDEGVFVDDIADGSMVAFTYTEKGQRAVIEMIDAVDEPLEGEVMHGTYIGQIDAQSVEISYFQAFALGEDVSVEDIDDGSEIVFTYQADSYRPILETVALR